MCFIKKVNRIKKMVEQNNRMLFLKYFFLNDSKKLKKNKKNIELNIKKELSVYKGQRNLSVQRVSLKKIRFLNGL